METRTIHEQIEDAVTYMTLGGMPTKWAHLRAGLRAFDGVEFMAATAQANPGDSGLLLPTDAHPRDLHGRLNFGAMVSRRAETDARYAMYWARQMERARGLPLARCYVRVSAATVGDDGASVSGDAILMDTGTPNAPKWCRWRTYRGGGGRADALEAGVDVAYSSDAIDRWCMTILPGLQFTSRYFWRVLIGHEDNPRVGFMTDPTGASEIFRLRDTPEGRARRAALRNWVTEHWRKDRQDPGVERKVREHLRGATTFGWGGLSCTVVPCAYDIHRENLAKQRAEADRASGANVRMVEHA